jgi:glucose-6-phosphate isomerase
MWRLENVTTENKDSTHSLATAGWKSFSMNLPGFAQLPERSHLWATCEARAREVRLSSHQMVILGIGGSSNGAKALLRAVQVAKGPHRVVVFDNIDSVPFWSWLREQRDLSETHWVIASKSGSTIEPLAMAEFVDQNLRTSGFRKLSQNCTVITESGENPLASWAQREGVFHLEVPKDVGGRFSVLSPIGMFPAAFAGMNLDHFREGAQWALTQEALVTKLAAQMLSSFGREEWITLLWSYSEGLVGFGDWLRQLWAESLAKAKTRKGLVAPRVSTPMPCVGTSDQHSILQQVMEGARDKHVWFFRVLKSEAQQPALERAVFDMCRDLVGHSMGRLFAAEADATRDALAAEGIQSLTLVTDQLDERSMGGLFMLMQLVISVMGECLDINAYDQPGVELGKTLMREALKRH